ncbi:MAG TPA: 3-mercaptopyruvate sulfurtransferase [Hyphomicrobiales bacterium]|nr:3-mercaptopyruvate sulfurtransferase [Rhodobiaceae bacterium]HXK54944.1 3-mercaptopyruvate sulfurtransferase [Hyphomicrobiales bacterium]
MKGRDQLLVSTQWLMEHLAAPDLVIIDSSWYLPGQDRDPKREYRECHIPGALFFDIDEIADENSPLPHMLPSPVKFSSRMRAMGIGDGKRIVVYDGAGLPSASRCWWTFMVMGHDDVAVLDGGLPKWIAEGGPVEQGTTVPQQRHFTARRDAGKVCDLDTMRAIVEGRDTTGAQIVDARPADRFAGTAPEPRPGLKSGRMPGAINVPYTSLLNADGTMRSNEEIKAVFEKAGVNLSRPIVTSCGSGITAATLALALAIIGHPNCAVYDGSWCEWGASEELPVVAG